MLPVIQGAMHQMAVQKPRGNDGPVKVERDSRGNIIFHLPLEGGGRRARVGLLDQSGGHVFFGEPLELGVGL